MTEEQWRPVLGYEGFYSVSNLGRVRRDKTITRGKAGHIMKLTLSRGYLHVGLSKPGVRPAAFRVHRLVWEAFNGPIPPKLVINHIDGKPGNNELVNLECVTVAENVRHAFRELGRRRPGEKLTAEKVVQIRTLKAGGETLSAIGRSFEISPTYVRHVVTGKTWKHAGGPITPARALSQTPQQAVARNGPEVVADVVRRYNDGEGTAALARELGVSKRTILNWCQGKTRNKGQ